MSNPQPELVPLAAYLAARERIAALEAELAASRKRVDELAAALKRARELMGWSDAEVQDNKAQYEKLKDSLYDPAAIVEEIRREAALEALRGVEAKLIPAFSREASQYCKGWNDGLRSALGEVRAAIAALEQGKKR